MPELPEVETVRRGLAPAMVGRRIVAVECRRSGLRRPFPEHFVERLEGAVIAAIDRRAKYLLVRLSTGEVLIVHLGMSGSFRVTREGEATVPGVFHRARDGREKHDHVVLRLEDGGIVTYNDPRRFGVMDLVAEAGLDAHPALAGLGVEPLGGAITPAVLARLFAGRAAPLKTMLLDQRLVAGLGNIYVCEALWRAKLDPRGAAGDQVDAKGRPKPALKALATAIGEVLDEAIAAGGSSLRDHARVDGELGYFQHTFAVYDREGEPCARPACDGVVERIVQSGRSTFYCPSCQGVRRSTHR
jgi:formamidopyrimidine-DNA glycosylase